MAVTPQSQLDCMKDVFTVRRKRTDLVGGMLKSVTNTNIILQKHSPLVVASNAVLSALAQQLTAHHRDLWPNELALP